jgi:hypothetical protein
MSQCRKASRSCLPGFLGAPAPLHPRGRRGCGRVLRFPRADVRDLLLGRRYCRTIRSDLCSDNRCTSPSWFLRRMRSRSGRTSPIPGLSLQTPQGLPIVALRGRSPLGDQSRVILHRVDFPTSGIHAWRRPTSCAASRRSSPCASPGPGRSRRRSRVPWPSGRRKGSC